jgi:hypothetical protein
VFSRVCVDLTNVGHGSRRYKTRVVAWYVDVAAQPACLARGRADKVCDVLCFKLRHDDQTNAWIRKFRLSEDLRIAVVSFTWQ